MALANFDFLPIVFSQAGGRARNASGAGNDLQKPVPDLSKNRLFCVFAVAQTNINSLASQKSCSVVVPSIMAVNLESPLVTVTLLLVKSIVTP